MENTSSAPGSEDDGAEFLEAETIEQLPDVDLVAAATATPGPPHASTRPAWVLPVIAGLSVVLVLGVAVAFFLHFSNGLRSNPEHQAPPTTPALIKPVATITGAPAQGTPVGTPPAPVAEAPATGAAVLAPPAPVTAAAPAPPPLTGPQQAVVTEVERFLAGWKKDWEKLAGVCKPGKKYADRYAPTFKSTAPKKMNRKQWLAHQRVRCCKRKSVSVSMQSLSIVPVSRTKATVSFRQLFQADDYSDEGTKTLTMAKVRGKWKITAENWVP